MKYAIVTGVSKGLGASIANYLLEAGIHVIGISRNENKTLIQKAKENRLEYMQLMCDLSNLAAVKDLQNKIIDVLSNRECSLIYLVNNAATVEPIEQAKDIDTEALIRHYHLNVLTPMLLTKTLLKFSRMTPFIGVNISSGAANHPYYGWSAYCSSKAAIDMYTKTVALEQIEQKTAHKIFAFSPGVMDTDMQAEIRRTDKSQFAAIDTFKNYKKEKLLKDTDVVATVLVDILTDETTIENGRIYQVKDYL